MHMHRDMRECLMVTPGCVELWVHRSKRGKCRDGGKRGVKNGPYIQYRMCGSSTSPEEDSNREGGFLTDRQCVLLTTWLTGVRLAYY